MKYSVETLPRMDADIKKKAGLYTNNTFIGENNFEKVPKVIGVHIGSNNLNGTNYLMVYGTGTPEENAAELQAAYNEAKKMPRHLGKFDPWNSINIYEGQTFVNSSLPIKVMIATDNFNGTIQTAPAGTFAQIGSTSESAAALARRVSVIVAPGEYNFVAPSSFTLNSSGIDVKSLTGKKDVLINSVSVSSDYVYVSGINCGVGKFTVSSGLSNIIIENCEGGNDSFGAGVIASGIFNYCTGGSGSFGSGGTASGAFNNCIGGDYSFGGDGGTASGAFNNCIGGVSSFGSGGTLNGTLTNCKLTTGTFETPTGEGKIYNCIDGNGNLINTPLPIFADNAAAASHPTGTMYRTATGVQMIKY